MPRLYILKPTHQPQRRALLADDHPGVMTSFVGRVGAFIEGILADNEVNAAEAESLLAMLEQHRDAILNQWGFPLSTLLYRVRKLAVHGIWGVSDLSELRDCLRAFIDPVAEAARPTGIFFNDPPPPVSFAGKRFAVSGTFAYGSRAKVEEAITSRGGTVKKAIANDTDFVVVGTFISEGWSGGNYGNKIADASSMRDQGHKVAIVSEQHWQTFLT